jgi:hypothetical protein
MLAADVVSLPELGRNGWPHGAAAWPSCELDGPDSRLYGRLLRAAIRPHGRCMVPTPTSPP